MAVIQLPKFQQPQAKIPGVIVKNDGSAEVAKAKFQFQSNIWNGIISLAQTGISLWKRHEATVAQDEFDKGKLAYAKAMDEAEFSLASNPISPTIEKPYPSVDTLQKVHEEMIKGLDKVSNDTVRNALNNYYEAEYLKRSSTAKLGDLKTARAKSFDDMSENFTYFVQQGNLDEARNVVSTMRGMGLIDDVMADNLLDGAYQSVNSDIQLSSALAINDRKKGAEYLSKITGYQSYDKERGYTNEQKTQLLERYDRRWKDAESAALQQKEQNWFQATDAYTKAILKSTDISSLVKLRDSVLADNRLNDFKDHTGKKEHYVKLIDSMIDEIRNPKDQKEKDWTPLDTIAEIDRARFDESISNRMYDELLERKFIDKQIAKPFFDSRYGKDNQRKEALFYSNGFKLIDESFDRFIAQNKNLKADQIAQVNELRGRAANDFNTIISNPDLIGMKADARKKYVEDKAAAIVAENNWKSISKLVETDMPVLTKELYSDTVSGMNAAKEFQEKVQSGRMVITDQTRERVNQHQFNMLRKMQYFTGSNPTRTIDTKRFADQNDGEPYFMYQADSPRTNANLSPAEMRKKGAIKDDIKKFYVADPQSGKASQLYRIRLNDETKAWRYQIWDGKGMAWTDIDDSFKKDYWPILEQSYFKNKTPGFMPQYSGLLDGVLKSFENLESGT